MTSAAAYEAWLLLNLTSQTDEHYNENVLDSDRLLILLLSISGLERSVSCVIWHRLYSKTSLLRGRSIHNVHATYNTIKFEWLTSLFKQAFLIHKFLQLLFKLQYTIFGKEFKWNLFYLLSKQSFNHFCFPDTSLNKRFLSLITTLLVKTTSMFTG